MTPPVANFNPVQLPTVLFHSPLPLSATFSNVPLGFVIALLTVLAVFVTLVTAFFIALIAGSKVSLKNAITF